MATYVIKTQWTSGEAATGRRVTLAGQGLLDGMTNPVYTDHRGTAVIEIDAVPVTVYVDGDDRGTAYPGTFVATIR